MAPPKHEENDDDDNKYKFDYKSLFALEYLNGGYYNYEIVKNDANLIFEPDEENYTPKKTGNSIIYSGFYNFDLKEYDDEKYAKESDQTEKEHRLREWLDTKKLAEFHPLKFKME